MSCWVCFERAGVCLRGFSCRVKGCRERRGARTSRADNAGVPRLINSFILQLPKMTYIAGILETKVNEKYMLEMET